MSPIHYCEKQSITHVLMLDGQWHEVKPGSVVIDGKYATWLTNDETGSRITCFAGDVKGVKQQVPAAA